MYLRLCGCGSGLLANPLVPTYSVARYIMTPAHSTFPKGFPYFKGGEMEGVEVLGSENLHYGVTAGSLEECADVIRSLRCLNYSEGVCNCFPVLTVFNQSSKTMSASSPTAQCPLQPPYSLWHSLTHPFRCTPYSISLFTLTALLKVFAMPAPNHSHHKWTIFPGASSDQCVCRSKLNSYRERATRRP